MSFPIQHIRDFSLKLISTSFFLILIACAEIFDLPDPVNAPRITSIYPDKGGAGTTVTLEGLHFNATIAENIVKFNGVEAVITSATEKKITAIVPERAGTGKVELVVSNHATEGPLFTFFDVPLIDLIDPVKGPSNTDVTIIGRYFDKEASKNIVKFGGKAATVKSAVSDTLLVAIVPVDAISGAVTVTVNDVTGTGPMFEFITGNEPVHTITGITPVKGTSGTVVKILGQNFDSNPGNNIVKFNGIQSVVTSSTTTEINTTAPENGSTGLVSLTINGLTANGPIFTYEEINTTPTITNFDPKNGPVGTVVTITGTNFGNDIEAILVKFNGVAAPVQEGDGGSSITVAVPQEATTGPITVTVNDATATSSENFTVKTADPPIMTTYPTSLRVRETFNIIGTNFSNVPGENIVKINDFSLEVKSATTTNLEVYVSDRAANGSMSLTVNGVKAVFGGRGDATELEISVNQWAPASNLLKERHGHTATLLNNGKVLVAGGKVLDEFQNSAEIYDPATDKWTQTGYLHLERAQHTAALLPDGKVLVVGSFSPNGVLHQCEIFDPSTGIWTLTGHLNTQRALHNAALLDNGNVLVVSGSDGDENNNFGRPLLLASCEIYNPATGQWSFTGSLNEFLMPTISLFSNSKYTAVAKLQNGKVFFAGYKYNAGLMDSSCEIYDPATGIWTPASTFQNPQSVNPLDLVLLKNGDVFLSHYAHDNKYNIYKPSSNSWDKVGNNISLTFHENSATLMDDGQVLMAGGYNAGGPTHFSKVFNPESGVADNDIGNIADRQWHAAIKLKDGTVLISGGLDDFSHAMKRCEIFVPTK